MRVDLFMNLFFINLALIKNTKKAEQEERWEIGWQNCFCSRLSNAFGFELEKLNKK